MGRFPSELEGKTTYTIEIRGPRWLRRLASRVCLVRRLGVTSEEIQELEALAFMEANEEDRLRREQEARYGGDNGSD